MRRLAPFLALLVVGAVLASCGGDGKPSAEECAEEAAKLFQSVDDLDQIDDKIQELQDKGCQDVGGDAEGQGDGPGATNADLSRLRENLSSECLELSASIAAKAREALAKVNDAEALQRSNDELRALQDDLKAKCPQYAGE